MPKIYHDDTFEKAARKAGAYVRCLWQQRGPEGTMIAWIECLQVNRSVVMVQTYTEGGWDVFTCLDTNSAEATIEDALTRCHVTSPVV